MDKLQDTLGELVRELHSLDSLDPQTRRSLEDAAREINAALDKGESTLPAQSLVARLGGAAEKFEYSHPTLFRLVGNVIDALAQLGI